MEIQHHSAYRERVESWPMPRNLGELFDEAVNRYSTSIVWETVGGDDCTLTYGELARLVAQMANALRACGVRKGTHVGVMLRNRPEFLISWLALAKLGAVEVPINPGFTAAELRYVLADADVEHVVLTPQAALVLHGIDGWSEIVDPGKVYVLDGITDADATPFGGMVAGSEPEFIASEDVGQDDVCNILYTSGSTGMPKGCLIPHRYWMQMGAIVALMGPEFSRIQCDYPFYYMGPLWRFTAGLLHGAALCVAERYSLSDYLRRLRDHRIDFASMKDLAALAAAHSDNPPQGIKLVATFGLRKDLCRPLEGALSAPVRDFYGMTEIGWGIVVPLEGGSLSGSGSCGLPAPFRECRIVDGEGKDVDRGEPGELVVRGPGMFRGYYNKPQANENAFYEGGWFRTGDVFRQDKAGNYYIIGRIKEMIRRSGENVSPTEVEAAITRIPYVKEAAVIGVQDEKRGEEIKACIILRPPTPQDAVDPEQIRAECARYLAAFKIPRYVQYFESFPRTSSNKIARSRLANGEGETVSSIYDASVERWI